MANVVAIEHISAHAPTEKFALQRLRDCRFSRARQSSEPDHRAAMPAPRCSSVRCDLAFDPENIFTLRNRAVGVNAAGNRAAAANPAVIDNHESPKLRDAIMIIDHERPTGL